MSQGHRVNIVELNNQELGAVSGPGCYQREIFAAMASQDRLDRELGLTHYRVTGGVTVTGDTMELISQP